VPESQQAEYNEGVLPQILPNWRAKFYADGIGLFPPEGRSRGGVRIRDRRRPLHAAKDLVDDLMVEMNLPGLSRSPIERITTAEGEYAALVTIFGTNGASFERNLGFIFGDDFYTQIDAITTVASDLPFFRKATRELAFYYSIGLGELRRRRYYYEPPAGWMGYPRGLITEWCPPGFPNHKASISAFPARPVVETPAGLLDRTLHELNWFGFRRTQVDEAAPIFNRHKLAGLIWRAAGTYEDGPLIHHDIAAFQDDRFYYVARLESTPPRLEEDRNTFQLVVDSIEPLPHSQPSVMVHDESMLNWVT